MPIISAVSGVAIVGAVGLGIDVGCWYETYRAMQNATDSAAIAGARNASSNFDAEAKAVSARYNFVDGTGGVTVTALNNQTCPDGQTNCYQVTINLASAPQFFSQMVHVPAPALTTSATAGGGQVHSYCMIALAGSGTDPAVRSNGAPKADLSNCSITSNTGMVCNGHNLNANFADAHGIDNGCGINQTSGAPIISDPYAYLASNIPANTCPSYPQEPNKKSDPPLPATNQWSGIKSLPAITIICGDLQLTGDVVLSTASPGSVVVIENGQLDMNGHILLTSPGAGLTIVFSGTNGSYTHAPTGGGTLDIAAPTSGPWSGVAIYQDPALTTGLDISAAGNSPTWNITGLVYLPHANVTFSGAVNKAANGASCFALVVDNITINGTGSILANGSCAAAGLNLATNTIGTIGLVR